MTATTHGTLVTTLTARGDAPAAIRHTIRVASVIFIAGLTAAAAQISAPVPFTDIPFTLQPMIVLLGGLALGSRLGAASQVLYLAAGIAGLPVFAASAVLLPGVGRLLGPTGGFLMAYPLAAFVCGALAERGFSRRYLTSVLALAVGLLVIYAFGATWLGLFARVGEQATGIGFRTAVMTGILPFVLADVVKLFVAAAIVPGIWRLLGRTS